MLTLGEAGQGCVRTVFCFWNFSVILKLVHKKRKKKNRNGKVRKSVKKMWMQRSCLKINYFMELLMYVIQEVKLASEFYYRF